MNSVDFYIQTETRKHDTTLQGLAFRAESAKTMADLVRLNMEVSHAAPATLKAVLRSSPARRHAEAAMMDRGKVIINAAVQALALHENEPDKEFLVHAGRFIQTTREPCRGHFPALYNLADRGLLGVKAKRFQNSKNSAPVAKP